MPQPFELNSIEKGIHCAAHTGGCFNLDANLFKPEAVDLTSFVFWNGHGGAAILTQMLGSGCRRPSAASSSIIY